MHIKYVICAKNDLSYHARLRRAVSRRLARLANICQDVSHGLARLADTRRAVLRGLARLARLADTRLDTFARVSRESREFGASGHCLNKIHFLDRRLSSLYYLNTIYF